MEERRKKKERKEGRQKWKCKSIRGAARKKGVSVNRRGFTRNNYLFPFLSYFLFLLPSLKRLRLPTSPFRSTFWVQPCNHLFCKLTENVQALCTLVSTVLEIIIISSTNVFHYVPGEPECPHYTNVVRRAGCLQ